MLEIFLDRSCHFLNALVKTFQKYAVCIDKLIILDTYS